jgi:hypothetical protein
MQYKNIITSVIFGVTEALAPVTGDWKYLMLDIIQFDDLDHTG